MTRVLAYDLGGSSLRVAVISDEREFLWSARTPMRIPKGQNGEYEADPNDWWAAFVQSCRSLEEQGADLSSVEAIAGCGFTRTQVPIDRNGEIAHPAITFQDSRGIRALGDYLEAAAPDLQERYDGLSPFHPIARLLWLRSRKPDVWSTIHQVLEPKDYINFRLTGEVVSDPISQNAVRSFFDAVADDAQSTAALGFDDSVLPRTLSPFGEIGRVRGDLPGLAALAGKPVFCGSTDTWSCVLGSGALVAGAAYCISGTSDVTGVLSSAPQSCAGLLTVRWGPELWQVGGPSQGAATRLTWAVNQFAPGKTISEALSDSLPGRGAGPIFLPFLEGERTPYWDSSLRAAFLGVDSGHGPAEFVRAVAEGINFLSREVLSRAEAATGTPVQHICFAGGLSNNALLCQLKADVTDRPVFVAWHKESGLVGAACLPGNSPAQLPQISRQLMAGGLWYHPQSEFRAQTDARFEIFKQAVDALRPVTRGLLAAASTQERTS